LLTNNCKSCDHFFDVGHSLGVCRRYPIYQNRGPQERCGEFSPIPKVELIELPVVEMPEEAPKVKRKYTRKGKE
jgi:hypothetical protein